MVAIVQLSVSQQVAPIPATLQQTGAMISQGGPLPALGTVTLLSGSSTLTPLYNGSKAVASLAWLSGTVTAQTTLPHGIKVGDVEPLVVAGVTPAGYNGTFTVTATGTNTFTYALAANPGPATVLGMYTLADVSELCAMNTTFWAQGANQSVYVLELGIGTPAEGVAMLAGYIAANLTAAQPLPGNGANPSRFYSYLVPREWAAEPAFLALKASYQAPSSMLYFWVTSQLGGSAAYTNFGSLDKDVIQLVEAPAYGAWPANQFTALAWANGLATATTASAHGVAVGQWFQVAGCVPVSFNGYAQAAAGTAGSTLVWSLATNPGAETALGSLLPSYTTSAGVAPVSEFTLAGPFRNALAYRPSATNRVTPFAYQFEYGVTPFPTPGNSSLLQTLDSAAVNVIDTGAEGGISNAILKFGTTMDGQDFTYWYATDWVQINVRLAVANAIINGSNDPINPLYYDQAGIDRLQAVIATTMNTGVTFGLVLGSAVQTSFDGPALHAALDAGNYPARTVVNAVPFIPYSNENPGDYALGLYSGFAIEFTPKRGFKTVRINITVSDFVTNT